MGRRPSSPKRFHDSVLETEAESVRQGLQTLGEAVGLKPAEVFCYAASGFHKQIPYKQALSVERAITEVAAAFNKVSLESEQRVQLDGLFERWRAVHQQSVARAIQPTR